MAAAAANPKAATGLLVSLAITLTCTAVSVRVAPGSPDVPVEAPPVALPTAVPVAVASLDPVGALVAAAVPVPVEVLTSHPDPVVDFGMDMVL